MVSTAERRAPLSWARAVGMEAREHLSDFDKGQVFMARHLGQSISETARLVGCSVSAVQDVLDLEKKLTKLTTKREKLEKQVEKLEEKMKKSVYSEKVSEKVQEQDAEKLRQSQTELEKVKEAIEKLM